MRLLHPFLRLIGTDRPAADRAAAVIAGIHWPRYRRAAIVAALLYAELVLFGVMLGGGQ